MLCPTCQRTCGDAEEVCLRCRTPLREQVVTTPIAERSSGRSWGWLWSVMLVLLAGSVFRTCTKAMREGTAQAQVAPVDEATATREAFLTAFNSGCLKKSGPKFCDCAGPKLLENFKIDEIEAVIESTRNGKPDVRMSAIIVQCSR